MESRDSLVEAAYEAPADELERAVADIIAAILGVDKMGRRDSFYDLGGSSMQAIRICARVERETGHSTEPVWLLEHDELADFVEQIRRGAEDSTTER